MQTVTRYLLSNLVIGYISGYHGRNSKVYDRRITLHRGVSNPVSFTFKNEDQKAQDITTKTYEFNIIDSETKKSALTRNLIILDDGSSVTAKGTASVTITNGDLLKLEAKFYNFSVREVKSDNSREVTYADTGYNAAGTLEVIDGAYPDAINSTSVTSFTVTTGPLQYTSGAINAKPGNNNNKALHTIAVYTKSFTGTVRVQGTMSASPADADYFNITMDGKANPTNTFSDSTTVTNYNFYGVYHSVRFSWDNDTGNNGIVDKILYRQ
jgi:hypothetical protein